MLNECEQLLSWLSPFIGSRRPLESIPGHRVPLFLQHLLNALLHHSLPKSVMPDFTAPAISFDIGLHYCTKYSSTQLSNSHPGCDPICSVAVELSVADRVSEQCHLSHQGRTPITSRAAHRGMQSGPWPQTSHFL